MKNEDSLIRELKSIGLEAETTTTDTLLTEMGASVGKNSCSSVIIISNH